MPLDRTFYSALKEGKEAIVKYQLKLWEEVAPTLKEITLAARLIYKQFGEPVITYPHGICIGQLIAYVPRDDGTVEIVVGRVSPTGKVVEIYTEPLKDFGVSGPLRVRPSQLISAPFSHMHNPFVDVQIIGVDIYGNDTADLRYADFYEKAMKYEREINEYRMLINRYTRMYDEMLRVKRMLELELARLRLDNQDLRRELYELKMKYNEVKRERDELYLMVSLYARMDTKIASIFMRDLAIESEIEKLKDKIRRKELEEIAEKYGIAERKTEK